MLYITFDEDKFIVIIKITPNHVDIIVKAQNIRFVLKI